MYVDPNIIDSTVYAKIKEARAYYSKDSNLWYLTVTYSYTDKNGSCKELEIPAIPLPLPQNHLPVVRDANRDVYYPAIGVHEYMPSIVFENELMLDKGCIHDQEGILIRGSKCFYAIKEVPKKMTQAEIEEALGYKISIVKEGAND